MRNLRETIKAANSDSITLVIKDRLDDIDNYVKELSDNNGGVRITPVDTLYKFGKVTGYKLKAELYFKYSLSETIVNYGTGYHPLAQEMEIPRIIGDIESNGYKVTVEEGVNNR